MRLFLFFTALVSIAFADTESQAIQKEEKNLPPAQELTVDTEELINQAKEYLKEGKLQEAENIYLSILKKDPKNKAALGGIDFIASKWRNDPTYYYNAIELYEILHALYPKNSDYTFYLGALYYHVGDDQKAKEILIQGREVSPDYYDIHVFLGLIYLREKNFDAAAKAFQTALTLVPNGADALIGMGRVELERGNVTSAIDYFQRAVNHYPDNPDYHILLAQALFRKGKARAAERELYTVIQTHPTNTQAKKLLKSYSFVTHPRVNVEELRASERELDLVSGQYATETNYLNTALPVILPINPSMRLIIRPSTGYEKQVNLVSSQYNYNVHIANITGKFSWDINEYWKLDLFASNRWNRGRSDPLSFLFPFQRSTRGYWGGAFRYRREWFFSYFSLYKDGFITKNVTGLYSMITDFVKCDFGAEYTFWKKRCGWGVSGEWWQIKDQVRNIHTRGGTWFYFPLPILALRKHTRVRYEFHYGKFKDVVSDYTSYAKRAKHTALFTAFYTVDETDTYLELSYERYWQYTGNLFNSGQVIVSGGQVIAPDFSRQFELGNVVGVRIIQPIFSNFEGEALLERTWTNLHYYSWIIRGYLRFRF